jgi:hypothetical protein
MMLGSQPRDTTCSQHPLNLCLQPLTIRYRHSESVPEQQRVLRTGTRWQRRNLAVDAAWVVNDSGRAAYRGVRPVFASRVFCGVGC